MHVRKNDRMTELYEIQGPPFWPERALRSGFPSTQDRIWLVQTRQDYDHLPRIACGKRTYCILNTAATMIYNTESEPFSSSKNPFDVSFEQHSSSSLDRNEANDNGQEDNNRAGPSSSFANICRAGSEDSSRQEISRDDNHGEMQRPNQAHTTRTDKSLGRSLMKKDEGGDYFNRGEQDASPRGTPADYFAEKHRDPPADYYEEKPRGCPRDYFTKTHKDRRGRSPTERDNNGKNVESDADGTPAAAEGRVSRQDFNDGLSSPFIP